MWLAFVLKSAQALLLIPGFISLGYLKDPDEKRFRFYSYRYRYVPTIITDELHSTGHTNSKVYCRF